MWPGLHPTVPPGTGNLTPRERGWFARGLGRARAGHEGKSYFAHGSVLVWIEPWNSGCLGVVELSDREEVPTVRKLELALERFVLEAEVAGYLCLRTDWIPTISGVMTSDAEFGVSVSIFRAVANRMIEGGV